MRLSLILTICLQLSILLANVQAGSMEDLPTEIPAGISESTSIADWNLDAMNWRRRGDDIRQLLEPPKYDFEKVGYQIGSLEALKNSLNPSDETFSLANEAISIETGIGSDTLNWVREIQSVKAGTSENSRNPAVTDVAVNEVDQAQADQPPVAGQPQVIEQTGDKVESAMQSDSRLQQVPERSSFFQENWLNPNDLFVAPTDPSLRDYTPAPEIPLAEPPKVKALWREYADWLHGGFITWTERLELGGSFLEGNTNQEAFNTAARFSRDTTYTTTQINIGGNHAQSKMTTTQNRWYGDTTTDFKRKGNWLYFVRSLHEYDQFTNLDYRGTASFGMGYRFFNEENRKLIVRYGPGVTQEVFHTPRVVRTSPDLFAEVESKWPIGPRVIFEEKATIHPNIINFGMVRILNTTGFLIPLDDQKRWNLKVGFRYEYNSRPNANRHPSDFATNVNIVYSRK